MSRDSDNFPGSWEDEEDYYQENPRGPRPRSPRDTEYPTRQPRQQPSPRSEGNMAGGTQHRPRRRSREEVLAELRRRQRPQTRAPRDSQARDTRAREAPARNNRDERASRVPQRNRDYPEERIERPMPRERGYPDEQSRRYPPPTREYYEAELPYEEPRSRVERDPRRTTHRLPEREYEEDYRTARQGDRYPTARRQPRRGSEPQFRRRPWSGLLFGCLGALLTIALIAGGVFFLIYHVLPSAIPGIGTLPYNDKPHTLTLPFNSNTTQLQVHNTAGDISITTDINASQATLTYTRNVQAKSSSEASAEFARINVVAQKGNSASCPAASCVSVNVTTPSASTDTVTLKLVLPQSQNPSTPFALSATTQSGTIAVTNFIGLLNLTNNIGNINVSGKAGILDAGSCLQTYKGNIVFNGLLNTQTGPTVNPCTSNPPSSQGPWYTMTTGTGNIDATIPANQASHLALKADVVIKGKFDGSAFGIQYTQAPDGSASFSGPLQGAASSPALLKLYVGDTGNITLHKS